MLSFLANLAYNPLTAWLRMNIRLAKANTLVKEQCNLLSHQHCGSKENEVAAIDMTMLQVYFPRLRHGKLRSKKSNHMQHYQINLRGDCGYCTFRGGDGNDPKRASRKLLRRKARRNAANKKMRRNGSRSDTMG